MIQSLSSSSIQIRQETKLKNKSKNSKFGSVNDIVWWGACSMQGWRCSMEDAHICSPIDLGKGEKGMLFGVFDGHGGKEVAEFTK
mgnify:CR=1 FL=1